MRKMTLKQDQAGLWSVPDLIELNRSSGQMLLDRTLFPKTAGQIVFGRGVGAKYLAKVVTKMPSKALVVVGASSSKTPAIRTVLAHLGQSPAETHVFQVHGRADHRTVRRGIEFLHKIQARQVIVIGGGTTLDVGKAIAGLAAQEGGTELAAYQRGERTVDPEKALPWIAVPTTSGTGSESTNNAVIELGEEKRSIRNIPPPALIIADPSLTDSLPLSSSIISLVDAVAQSLEVITHAAATPEVQAVTTAAFLNLAQGLPALNPVEENISQSSSGNTGHREEHLTTGDEISPQVRDTLSWGSLLMGIALAHSGLGLPHGLVHFCRKFGLSHGHMVGILLSSGLQVQAECDPATARRLAKVGEALTGSFQGKNTLSISFEDETSASSRQKINQLLGWLDETIASLFAQIGLATSLEEAGLNPADLDWIAAREYALGTSFGIPRRRANMDELRTVLQRAWSKHYS